MKEYNLSEEKIWKLYFVYGLTSMLGVLIFSVYGLIDSIFIGRCVGDEGMAAVTLSSPILSFFCALALILSVGCGTRISSELGKADAKNASKLFTLGFKAVLLISICTMLIMSAFAELFARAYGVDGAVFEYSVEYIRINGLFSVFFIIQGYLSGAVNAIGRPALAMISNASSGIVNIALDYFFIVKLSMGVAGAAIASGTAALISALICLIPIALKRMPICFVKQGFEWRIIWEMLYNGLSDGLSALSVGVIALVFNSQISRFFGSDGLTSYGVVQAVIQLFGYVVLGFSGGLNPIVANNLGSGRVSRVREAVRKFSWATTIIAGCLVAALIAGKDGILSLFGDLELDNHLTSVVFYTYCIMLVFTGLSTISVSYFTAIEDPKTSAILSVGRVVVLRCGLLFALPLLLGPIGLWISVPLSELAACLIGAYLMSKSLNRLSLQS